MAPSSSDIKRQDSPKEAPGSTIQDAVLCDVSSRQSSMDESTKLILQGRLVDLDYLVRAEEGLVIPQEHQRLIICVLNEIETWLNGGGTMEFKCQAALSNMVYNRPDKKNQCLCKDETCLLPGYLSLLRDATSNDALSDEKRQMLLNRLRDSELFLGEPGATTDKTHQDELNLLHVICDGNIALHSIETAVQTLDKGQRTAMLEDIGEATSLDRAIALMSKRVALTPVNQGRPKQLNILGYLYRSRFDRFGQATDIDLAIKRQLESVVSTPLNSADLPKQLHSLGNSYLRRFERFGNVKDLDSAIERHREAVASTALDSAELPGALNDLGISYMRRFERFGDVKDIDSAIKQQREAVASTPSNNAELPRRLNNLGHSHMRRFERFGEVKDIDSSIEQHCEAVASTPLDSADLPRGLNNLGNSHLCRFQRFGEVKDIDSAIERHREAVASTALDSADLPGALNNLGISHLRRYERFGEVEDIDAAIERHREAVASTPPNSAGLPRRLNNLGNSHIRRFERFGDVKDIDSAIERHSEAVASTPHDSTDLPGVLNNLGSSHLRRFERFGEVEDIDSAIECHCKAVASTPSNSPDLPTQLNNLGNSHMRRFERFGEVKDIDSAIERHGEAVASTSPNSADLPRRLSGLGNSHVRRFEWFGEVEDIDSAIERHCEAVASTPPNSPDLPTQLNNLGNSYMRRFERFGEVTDLVSAIERHSEAVASTPLKSADRPRHLSSLGNSHHCRFERFGEVKDIDAAIKRHHEAVASTPPKSAALPARLNSLGNSHLRRFERFREVKDIDSAIERQREAVASAPPSSAAMPTLLSNLGVSHQSRFEQCGEVKDLDSAIERHCEAVASTVDSADRSTWLNNLGASYHKRFNSTQQIADLETAVSHFRLSAISQNGIPSSRIRGSLEWAGITHTGHDFRSASEAYEQAIRLLPQVAWIGLRALAQLNTLDSGIQQLGCDAAACMISLAQRESHDEQRHLGRAIEFLDQGRSILWSQTSNFKGDLEELEKKNSQLAHELDLVGKALGQGCFRSSNDTLSEADAQLYRRSAQKWEELVCRIRTIPGFENFLLPPPISTLRTAIVDGPVVIINSSKYRRDAIIIPPQGNLVLVPLPNITTGKIDALANELETFTLRQSKNATPSDDNDGRAGGLMTSITTLQFERVLNQTWSLLGEVIVQKLKELGLLGSGTSATRRVWWCLTGSVSFLPIHASFPRNKPTMGMMDNVISSYTPTISALLRARQQRKKLLFQMLAVGQSNAPDMRPLPSVAKEIAFISQKLGADAQTLNESKATVDEVAALLPTCSWAHFACHGVQDPHNPMDSGLVLWNGHRLTLSRLAQSSLGSPEFAFLSCCQSAKGSERFPNEAVHLAAGLQFIGFRGVIGTMWAVWDNDALSIAMEVYEELFKDGTAQASPSDAALALHRAVCHLRDRVPLVRWVPFIHFGL